MSAWPSFMTSDPSCCRSPRGYAARWGHGAPRALLLLTDGTWGCPAAPSLMVIFCLTDCQCLACF
jgi:hypothetical protein